MAISVVTNPVTSSGSISANTELRTKIKETASGSVSLSELYRNGSFVPTAGTTGGVPTSGAISFSQFYGVNTNATANITGVEENLDAQTIFGTADYTSALKKTINVNGNIISQNTNPALTVPAGAGATIKIVLTSGGIFGHRGTVNGTSTLNGIGGNGGGANGGTGGAGAAGRNALTTLSNISIEGTGASIAGGGAGGGGGGGGGQEGSGGRNKRGYSCDFAGWQYCESCDSGVGGGSDSGTAGGSGGVGRGYRFSSGVLTLVTNTTGIQPTSPGNGGGTGGKGGDGGTWGASSTAGSNGTNGGTGPGGNCQGGGGGGGGGTGGAGASGGTSIIGYNRVVSIQSTAVLAGSTQNN